MRSEKGIALVFVALAVIAILFLAALALDINYFANAREQARQFSRLAALAAVEEYFATQQCKHASGAIGTCTYAEKAAAALVRVNQISSENNTAGSFSADKYDPLHKFMLVDSSQTADSAGGRLEIGRWQEVLGVGNTPIADQWEFKPIALNTLNVPSTTELPPNSAPNAFRVSGVYFPAAPAVLMGRLLNTHPVKIKSAAVATVIPRHGAVIIDTTGTMIAATHGLALDPVTKRPTKDFAGRDIYNRYAFNLTMGRGNLDPPELVIMDGNDNMLHWCAWRKNNRSSNVLPAKDDRGNFPLFPAHVDQWCWLSANYAKRPGGVFDPTLHYADDYVRRLVYNDQDYGSVDSNYHPNPNITGGDQYKVGQRRDYYMIDLFRSPGAYDGPEPLNSVLKAISASVSGFKTRGVSGDKLSLIFYDDKLEWPRLVKLSGGESGFKYLQDFVSTEYTLGAGARIASAETLASGGSPQFDSAADTPGALRGARLGLFPKEARRTNALLAFSEASTQLALGKGGVKSADFVVMISDNLSNCRRCNAGDFGCGVYRCSETYDFYAQSQREILELVNKLFVQQTLIPVHVLQIGGHVGPHTVDIINPQTGGCYTDEEFRACLAGGTSSSSLACQGVNGFALGNCAGNSFEMTCNNGVESDPIQLRELYSNKNSNEPFYQAANDAWKIAWVTGGIYQPIRSDPAPNCKPELCKATVSVPMRRTTDPKCRTQSKQVDDFMASILSQNPYQLVHIE